MKSKYFIFLLVLPFVYKAQVVYNAYAKVSAISGTTFSVSNVNEINHTFVNGEQVIVMQMQDNVIGTNTLNTAAFGNISSIQSTGLWEVKTVASQVRSGVLQSVTFSTPLANTYNITANSSVQLITFRQLSAAAFTTTNNITALAWDGNIGGVVALEIGTILTLNHNISANGLGFRGGNRSNDYYGGGTTCTLIDFATNSTNSAFKGEGIYKSTNANFVNGIAKILSGGGGGGQDVNGGGGGGSNFTAGGLGGIGWNSTAAGCPVATSPRGLGGIALSAFILPSRIFMGGGGGGGQQNNSAGTNGGNGGGIVIIKANTLATIGTCATPRSISANGLNAGNSGNDGAGGGGAAGTVILQIANFSAVNTCSVTITASGGNGGNVASTTHAGGGAGAQGVLVFSAAQPTTNIQATTINGNPGCNNSDLPCTSIAGVASGTNNSGIFSGINGVLPIELLEFEAELKNNLKVDLNWSIATDKNIHSFFIERSSDGLKWEVVGTAIDVKPNSGKQNYIQIDNDPLKGISYYRLKIKEVNGLFSYSPTRVIELKSNLPSISIYPNPAQSVFYITSTENINDLQLSIYDAIGKRIVINSELINPNQLRVSTSTLAKGLYFISVQNVSSEFVSKTKLIVE
jgi:Secretion system C-terminal sorting domain